MFETMRIIGRHLRSVGYYELNKDGVTYKSKEAGVVALQTKKLADIVFNLLNGFPCKYFLSFPL